MQLDWGLLKVRAGEWLVAARNVAGTALLAGLAVLLAAQAAGARREREVVAREGAALDREIARLQRLRNGKEARILGHASGLYRGVAPPHDGHLALLRSRHGICLTCFRDSGP